MVTVNRDFHGTLPLELPLPEHLPVIKFVHSQELGENLFISPGF